MSCFSSSLRNINFYNQVKKVLIRSGGPERRVNVRILDGLIHELRIKLEIVKGGLAAEKVMR